MDDSVRVGRARTASWVAISLLLLWLAIEGGAALVLDHYAALGRGNDVRILLVPFFAGYAVAAGSIIAGVVAVARRPHWTTWTVLGITVFSAFLWFALPYLLAPLLSGPIR